MTSRSVRYHADASAAFAHLGGTTRPHTVLLESADVSTQSGISSLAVIESSVLLTCQGDTVTVTALSPAGESIVDELSRQLDTYYVGEGRFQFPPSDAVEERERLTSINPVEPLRYLQNRDPDGLIVGGFAFDFVETFEDLPQVAESDNYFPDYQFVLAEVVLDINHRDHTAELRGPADKLAHYADILDTTIQGDTAPAVSGTFHARALVNDEEYCEMVSHLKKHIFCGDIYQVVPSRTFQAPCEDAFIAYRRLRESNPSPYMFYLRGEDFELFGASPESNLKFDAQTRTVQIYPVAGTAPRGLNDNGEIDHEVDIRNELTMRTDDKELSEHAMLVDLARNDLARIAVPGTRKVADLLHVDRYSRVMHLVSRVVAELDTELDALDAYRACMNMGTLTGAPKLRAMELLREVEGLRRGSYAGAVGYLKGGGDMDTCIVIRSAFVSGGVATVQAGAGVVRDSKPQSEANETLHKASAVLHALRLAAGKKNLEVLR